MLEKEVAQSGSSPIETSGWLRPFDRDVAVAMELDVPLDRVARRRARGLARGFCSPVELADDWLTGLGG
jgi:hypothetical protein